jgi:hypothetical protein
MRSFLPLALLCVVILPLSASAGVTVSSPGNGASVSSPFSLSAWATTCSGQSVSAVGFSLDNSPETTVVYSQSIKTQVGSPAGNHTLHVKAWGSGGAACVSSVTLHVAAQGNSSIAPSSAIRAENLQKLGGWKEEHDDAVGGGWSSGAMTVLSSPSRSGHARRFVSGYSNASGERYHLTFGNDPRQRNFLYDAWIYLDGSSSHIANLEMDLNQTMNNGQTVIFGVQCDGYTNTWDYTRNAGSPAHPIDQWVHSEQYCNPRTWSIHSWHHVQISYSRNDSGLVTYHSVWLDSKELPLNATVPSAFALGWGKTLLTNLQVDGYGKGGYAAVYLDDFSISRW